MNIIPKYNTHKFSHNFSILNGALYRQFRGIRMLNVNSLTYHLEFEMTSELY